MNCEIRECPHEWWNVNSHGFFTIFDLFSCVKSHIQQNYLLSPNFFINSNLFSFICQTFISTNINSFINLNIQNLTLYITIFLTETTIYFVRKSFYNLYMFKTHLLLFSHFLLIVNFPLTTIIVNSLICLTIEISIYLP